MVDVRSGRRFAIFFFVAAFLVLFLGRFLKPVDHLALTAAAPFNAVINSVATGLGDAVSGVVEGPRLKGENTTLRREMAKVLQQNVLLQERLHDDALIRRMAHYSEQNAHLELLGARVIGHDPNDLADYILIDKGTREGLRTGMTVVDAGGYFVGSISDVTRNMSKVLLMISPSSSVAAIDLRTRAAGLVEGRFGGGPQLHWVVTRASLRKGDFVVSSGQYNLFPRTLLLGQVARVYRSDVSDFQMADIQPATDFQNLELVQVVRNFVPSIPNKFIPRQ